MSNQNNYQLVLHCSNCDFKWTIDILKETPIENVQCPNCGLKTLKKPPRIIKSRYNLQ